MKFDKIYKLMINEEHDDIIDDDTVEELEPTSEDVQIESVIEAIRLLYPNKYSEIEMKAFAEEAIKLSLQDDITITNALNIVLEDNDEGGDEEEKEKLSRRSSSTGLGRVDHSIDPSEYSDISTAYGDRASSSMDDE